MDGGIIKRKRHKEIEIKVPIKRGRWEKDYRGIIGRMFVVENGGQAMKKKPEVCLELQRGQEILRSNYIRKRVSKAA